MAFMGLKTDALIGFIAIEFIIIGFVAIEFIIIGLIAIEFVRGFIRIGANDRCILDCALAALVLVNATKHPRKSRI
jgi:hypothetical protein